MSLNLESEWEKCGVKVYYLPQLCTVVALGSRTTQPNELDDCQDIRLANTNTNRNTQKNIHKIKNTTNRTTTSRTIVSG